MLAFKAVAHAGQRPAPTSMLGLERFGALRLLDMQPVRSKARASFQVTTFHVEEQRMRLAMQPAALKELTALSGNLQTLRLVYYEDVPNQTVSLLQASHAALLRTAHICICRPGMTFSVVQPWTLDVFSAFTPASQNSGLPCVQGLKTIQC